ncbi:hypothetical protein TPADAL_0505a [Treponema pallidum subsp. pallidum DAL-1]|uniref:Uncharacterized protein n=2 Tax=Treponema pallidum TaxID=160 RepID=A0AAU8S123_TREPL|nr:hypothetical protein TPESAMD_0505a [Treponema pallidum subsp. pertenue str. SamoaD]AEZ58696.1 hypothetical protein TPECDC2_0505a [Treponema pallidum subsp. pertenue str. CDC2]AEZ59764.1 hypothetical protein TPEGAU_0505a [Treponema pallidum subsp. pertenue str. Gauthier]AEZ60827.1 hypothetical protein TPADAL_0505a [Treponema pallidum subsp. pallidum DAL-1]AGK84149.1 hypothetical protein TPFB_0505a [Treponema pallidum str. Fribourg-Blanc]AJB40524.1 hypothetical protein TENDBA_0505a [Treponema
MLIHTRPPWSAARVARIARLGNRSCKKGVPAYGAGSLYLKTGPMRNEYGKRSVPCRVNPTDPVTAQSIPYYAPVVFGDLDIFLEVWTD